MTKLRNAATVVLLRPAEDSFEVFMLRRHRGHDFMAKVWVFPGGALDERDLVPEIEEVIDDGDYTALGLRVAAIRETFEESGLLLAHRRGQDTTIALDDEDLAKQIETLRQGVDGGEIGMVEVCECENLVLDVDSLGYLAHWITPHFESRRYDTHFFVAPAPPKQLASHDDAETTNSAWWSPQEALAKYRNEEILLAPPTIRVLEELTDFSSLSELLNDLDRRPAPPAILPHAVGLDSDELVLLLPGDPDYPADDPRLADATPIKSGITRMVRRDGQWWSAEQH